MFGYGVAGQKPDSGAQERRYRCGWPVESAQKYWVPGSFSPRKPLQTIVSPGASESDAQQPPSPVEQVKMTPVHS